MTDHHAEEQEMEAEALAAIFDTHFTILDNDDDDSKKNREWRIDLYPEHASDEDELQLLNHVAIQMKIELPKQYPADEEDDDDHLPKLQIMILKGLADDPHGLELQALAQEEAINNRGLPSIYAIAERLREWLVEHNRPGLDDTSAYATMMRKQEQEQKKAAAAMASTQYESQMAGDVMTVAEKEELAVHKRRSEGTPCNKESFEAWRERFDAEMAAQQNGENQTTGGTNGGDGDIVTTTTTSSSSKKNSKATATTTTSHRMTGYEYFSSKSTNLEALEAAAEQAEAEEEEEEDDDDEVGEENTPNHVNEELFDDDVDLDELDFDDDDDEDDDELDI